MKNKLAVVVIAGSLLAPTALLWAKGTGIVAPNAVTNGVVNNPPLQKQLLLKGPGSLVAPNAVTNGVVNNPPLQKQQLLLKGSGNLVAPNAVTDGKINGK